MPVRGSTLNGTVPSAITREIGSKYDNVKIVADNIDEVIAASEIDVVTLQSAVDNAQDDLDAIIAIVDTGAVVGDQGIQGIQGIQGETGVQGSQGYTGNQGLTGVTGDTGPQGEIGETGLQGSKGDKGTPGDAGVDGTNGVDADQLIVTSVDNNTDKSLTLHFSDGTSHTTEILEGDQGDQGITGLQGVDGNSVHHTKPTNTTHILGDFAQPGQTDTYSFYADADETVLLGFYNVYNGKDTLTYEEVKEYYEINPNTNAYTDAEKVQVSVTETTTELDARADLKLDKVGGVVSGALEVQGDFTVSGTTTSVNSTTVTTADNVIVLNDGEVGTGVTNGTAGIEIDRGIAASYYFMFDESDDAFKIGENGSLQKVATREDIPTEAGVALWNTATGEFITTRSPTFASISIDALGTVDGRDVSVDGAKLDLIEVSATSDQTATEIESLYEGIVGTEKYTTAEQTKLFGVEALADVTDTINVTSAGALMDSELAGIAAVKATTAAFLIADETKLDGIETEATADQNASEILTLIKTVDGSGSGLDSDLLDAKDSSFYRNATNINSGTISDLYLPPSISSDITGNANTATALETGRTIALTGEVTGVTATFNGSANATMTTAVGNLDMGLITEPVV